MKKMIDMFNEWNNNWVGDFIGGVCLFAIFFALFRYAPLLMP